MDVSETLDGNYSSSSDLTISVEIRSFLRETAKWAKFISIVGFVMIGLLVLMALGMSFFMAAVTSELGAAGMPFPPILFTIFYILFALFMLMPLLYLFKFANNMQRALRQNDQVALSDSFQNLKSHYKFNGIFLAVILGLYALIFIFSLIAGAAAFMM